MKTKKEVNKIKEVYVNRTEGYKFGSNDIDLDDTEIKTLKDLYKYGIKEFGKCISKMFIDRNNKPVHIGYVFLKKDKYEDTGEHYLREVWLSIERYTETTIRQYLEVV